MALTAEREASGGLPRQTSQSFWVPESSSSEDSIHSQSTGTHRSVFRQVRFAVRRCGSTPEVSYRNTPDTATTGRLAPKSPERHSLRTRFSSFDIASGFRELERRVSDVSHVLGVHQFHLVKPHAATKISPSTNTPRVSKESPSTVRYGSEDHIRTAIPPISTYLSPDMESLNSSLSGEVDNDSTYKHKDSVIILLERPVSDNDTIYTPPSPASSSSRSNSALPTTLSFGQEDTFASLDMTPIASPRPSLDLRKHYEEMRILPDPEDDDMSEPETEEISFNIPDYGLDDYDCHFDHDEDYDDEVEKVDIEIAFDVPDHQPGSPVCPINMVGHLRSVIDSNGRIKVRRCPLHSSDEFCIKGRMVRRGNNTRIVWSQKEGSI